MRDFTAGVAFRLYFALCIALCILVFQDTPKKEVQDCHDQCVEMLSSIVGACKTDPEEFPQLCGREGDVTPDRR